ncbi:TetR/AcrR family transcriptional regulator [Paenibacillus tepidiphilus]|uniref:TetR/AcrR family transcriptional regulator n=1 Tax=Paenibacillus tepidiphilus TaxID=2608683 RepID=UPI00123B3F73|nr:TetR/AcrR family transcriptional regulator [Paenibacillus tepidiphilus]
MSEKPTRRLPGRPKQADNKLSIQAAIIQTASQLFMENGYDAVSLGQIGERCRVTKPTIYYHFASKPELFTIAMITMFQSIRQLTSSMLDSADTLETGLINLAEASLANPHAEVETMIKKAEPFLEYDQIQQIRDAELKIHEVLAAHFRVAMDRQLLREDDPLFLAETFSTLMLMGNREIPAQKYGSFREFAQRLVHIFLRGAASS